jgi:ABC-type dipeptide/oligopeptide/nickel transport system permease subunit
MRTPASPPIETTAATSGVAAAPLKGVSLGRDAWRRLQKNRTAMAALIFLVGLVALAVFTPLLPLQPPQQVYTSERYAAPVFQLQAEQRLTLSEKLSEVPPRLAKARLELSETIEKLHRQREKVASATEEVDADALRLGKARTDLQDSRVRLRQATERVERAAQDTELNVDAVLQEYADAEAAFDDAQASYDEIAESVEWAADDEGSAKYDVELEELEIAKHQQRLSDILQAPYQEAGFGRLNGFNRLLVGARLATFGDWSLASLCGRDELGRDLLSRLFWGARVSLAVGFVSTLVSLVIGVTYGAISGYLGGWADNLMMRLVDVLYSIPFIFIVIFLVMILGQDQYKAWLEARGIDRITIFFVVVGAIYWLTMARVVRGQVMSLKHEQFIEAARALGASNLRIIFVHIVPNLWSVVIVYLTLTIPSVMLFEAFLSFLGLGVEPPNVSWGLLAHDGMKVINPVVVHWW